jgi:hypothetical protein
LTHLYHINRLYNQTSTGRRVTVTLAAVVLFSFHVVSWTASSSNPLPKDSVIVPHY